jgi:hypothetical protein
MISPRVTDHAGTKRLYLSIQQRLYHIDLRKAVNTFKYLACQKPKLDGAILGKPHTFHALTFIGTVTNLVETARLIN